ncbi:LysR family transcriptional regulator [Knoellia koreensis]|uniref:LysR family transcriptional regulator n=1 Tax=Knoellia koreensis TaxID=2730921 RepID=A0A849HKR5_9MICO|nr:LysR family transcriptional regulator [Knoellia sp. DB2414S]NNM45237.1 LysR family transcriptional regulator [Knoellia sp. DB2414S]
MELRQLSYFRAVARQGSFTRAAEQLHVAQPAVSAQVRQLERELGVELLHRTTRSVQLTHVGAQVLDQVDAALAQVDLIGALAEAHRGVEQGHVRIGATPITGGLDLVAALRRFRTRYPGVTLSMRTGLAAPLMERLQRAELDVVVAPVHEPLETGLRARRVATEQLVLITAPGDQRRIATLADVQDDPFVCLPADSGLRRLLDEAFAGVGASAHVEFETHSPASIRQLVSAGLGSALIAASATRLPGEAVTVHHLGDLPEHPPIAVVTAPQRHNAAAHRFATELLADREPSVPGARG